MKDRLKILYICPEITPYIPSTEVADICRNLPQIVQEKGSEIRTFMPCYGTINERRNQLHEVQRLSGMNLIIDESDHPLIIKVASIQAARMQVYFIDNDDYFKRKGIYGAPDEDVLFEDNDERSIFFIRGVLETVKKLRWTPDIIHCHGWMTATAPIYIKKIYSSDPFFEHSKIVYSVYDHALDGVMRKGFDKRVMLEGLELKDLKGVKGKEVTTKMLDYLALEFSDAIIDVSKDPDAEMSKYIKKHKLPYVKHNPESYTDDYIEFYKQLTAE